MVFVSYSWDSDLHVKRVERFISRLRKNGISVLWDRDMKLGERIPLFMEKSIIDCEYVLFICTPNYKLKSDSPKGGVGYERNIMTGEIYRKQSEEKFIPVLFEGDWNVSLPYWADGKLGIDLRSEKNAAMEYKRLFDTLLNFQSVINIKSNLNNKSKTDISNKILELIFAVKENLIDLIETINTGTDILDVLNELQNNFQEIYKQSKLYDFSLSSALINSLGDIIQKYNEFAYIHNCLSKTYTKKNTEQFTSEVETELVFLEQKWNFSNKQLQELCNNIILQIYNE